jgi:hypothetical protein
MLDIEFIAVLRESIGLPFYQSGQALFIELRIVHLFTVNALLFEPIGELVPGNPIRILMIQLPNKLPNFIAWPSKLLLNELDKMLK